MSRGQINNPEVVRAASAKYEKKRKQVISAIKVRTEQAPRIERLLKRISKKHDGNRTAAILEAIRLYAEKN